MNPDEMVENDPHAIAEAPLTPEQEKAIAAENIAKMDAYIQESFIREGGDISQDFNKSNKKQIDTTIQQAILGFLQEYFKKQFVTMEDALTYLNSSDLHLNVFPSKKEFGKYGLKIMILQSVAEKEFSVNAKTNLEVNPL